MARRKLSKGEDKKAPKWTLTFEKDRFVINDPITCLSPLSGQSMSIGTAEGQVRNKLLARLDRVISNLSP